MSANIEQAILNFFQQFTERVYSVDSVITDDGRTPAFPYLTYAMAEPNTFGNTICSVQIWDERTKVRINGIIERIKAVLPIDGTYSLELYSGIKSEYFDLTLGQWVEAQADQFFILLAQFMQKYPNKSPDEFQWRETKGEKTGEFSLWRENPFSQPVPMNIDEPFLIRQYLNIGVRNRSPE